ncbi:MULTISPECIES: prolyl oligopeptidase family serine peptidase [unclassified Actinopolyspora]|uniref:prolyl oligopeptidase family serine peptidase n=1 Tax=Actinopolyspora TaxID=1849 RepID=UPI0013F5D215|nr:S9 family peptidase [Actinopolyspora sp. BKK2]NHE77623.1 S9 family peptidase [Actinopolyspora sp. BKK1]
MRGVSEVQPASGGYPQPPREDLVENLHGYEVHDPYRWLEDPEDPRCSKWLQQQDELSSERLADLPGRDPLAERIRALMSTGSVSAPTWRNGRSFFTRRGTDREFPVLFVRDESGTETPLVDVARIDPSGLTTLDRWTPSREGDRLAYQISTGGDEESLLYVMSVETGELLDGPIDRCRYSSIAWLPGGEEFYYIRRLPPEDVPEDEQQFHRRVWRHEVGKAPCSDVLIHGEHQEHTYFFDVDVSADGGWLLIHGSPGTARRDSLWIAELDHAGRPGPPRLVLDDSQGVRIRAGVELDGRLHIRTTLNAPRGRLCVADPHHPDPAYWTELLAEDPTAVLEATRLVEAPGSPPELAVLRTRHAVSELTLHHTTTGERVREVALPGTGQVTALNTTDPLTGTGGGRLWIGWTDFVTAPCVRTYSLGDRATELFESAPGQESSPNVNSTQLSYTSTDGTTVRMFVLYPSELETPLPTLLTGYGGFALSREPAYTPTALAWVETGGVWALASLRGGAEEGEQWHRAGMRENKQRVFDDFHSAALHLVDQGWTSTDRLAISGGSNGGLLVGAAVTQRPELYRAAVCSAPLLDMVRYEHFLLGRLWSEEYGSAEVPEELGWLLAYSPYHNVSGRTEYPAMLFSVFESDTRVDPLHARKMCAAVQHATSSPLDKSPILLRRETEVGHSARSVSRTVGMATDHLAFLAAATGLLRE